MKTKSYDALDLRKVQASFTAGSVISRWNACIAPLARLGSKGSKASTAWRVVDLANSFKLLGYPEVEINAFRASDFQTSILIRSSARQCQSANVNSKDS